MTALLLLAAAVVTAGSYVSDGCGERTYKRGVILEADATFTAEDIPHPCPGECVVQHVLRRTGHWQREGSKVRLTVAKTDDSSGVEAKASLPLPPVFHFDAKSGTLSERAGKVRCDYQRLQGH